MWQRVVSVALVAVVAAGCGNNLGKVEKTTVPIAAPPASVPVQKGPPVPGTENAPKTPGKNAAPSPGKK